MRRLTPSLLSTIAITSLLWGVEASAQPDTAITRMRPLGSPSAVDQFRRDRPHPVTTAGYSADGSTGHSAAVRQTVWMQNGLSAPPLEGSGIQLPGSQPTIMPNPNALPNEIPFPEANTITAAPQTMNTPRALPTQDPSQTILSTDAAIVSSSDATFMAQPQLTSSGFATVDNCNLITGPSPYQSAGGFGCGCGPVVPTTYAAPASGTYGVSPITMPAEIPSSATIVPPSVFPPTTQTIVAPAATTASAPRALVSLGQDKYAVQLGQGLWGQPVAYVPGQGLRNWLRYFSF
ncbi:hypothetical protein NHH03_03125 [Stieleria sp. TO1_6]|uniref:hypothetical protein n=1 Tax=Stieleria tagensis TaxID=2956795 RepID=UPI00209AA7A9|nr:hypothetical protein [Stieleria tagensis]MCO8120715.1 hypothetical protein [Stieleria tagensis]